MAYTKTVWEDRLVENPTQFTITENGDGTAEIVANPGQVFTQGTPISAANLNKIEEQLETLDESAATLGGSIQTINNGLGNRNSLTTTAKTTHVAAINEVNAKVNQSEYQTATVSGAQIILQKPTALNRVFFKLDTDLTGNIRISTDGGTSSKNLVDFEGVQVTSLEKGYHEIISTANFFTLRNRGLSQSDLQALITITNEAEANESVLRTNYVNAVNEADGSINLPSNATWNDILLQVPNINASSKKFKTGTTTSGATNLSFTYVSGAVYSTTSVEVSDLDFKPSTIILRGKSADGLTVYCIDYSNLFPTKEHYPEVVKVYISTTSTAGQSIHSFKADVSNAYVNDTGFRLPAWQNAPLIEYEYIAFE